MSHSKNFKPKYICLDVENVLASANDSTGCGSSCPMGMTRSLTFGVTVVVVVAAAVVVVVVVAVVVVVVIAVVVVAVGDGDILPSK